MVKRIVIVDDDVDLLTALTDYLQIKGYEVVGTGKNGLEGLNLYKKFRPDYVFMDVMMEEYDGFFGLKMIKQFDPNAKVIIITAADSEETREKLIELKASDILYKPYSIEDILTSINNLENQTEPE